jgi:hypothetical protein
MKPHRMVAASVVGLCLPISASAEIVDRMASQSWLWGQGIVLGALALGLGIWRHWLSLFPALLGLVLLLSAWGDAHDPMFAPALQPRLGANYLLFSYLTPLIPVLVSAAVIGTHFWRRRTRVLPPNKSLERTREG